MTEKEFRKLRIEDLIEILMEQNNEVLRLQGELNRRKEELASYTKRNNMLKVSLDERDAETETLKEKLNESDARIHELETEIEVSKSNQWIDLDEIGSITEAARNLDVVFTEAQKNAESYLSELMEDINLKEDIEPKEDINLKKDMEPKEDVIRLESRQNLPGELSRIEYLENTEESVEDIERRYLDDDEELVLEDIENIEKRYGALSY